MVAGVWDTLSSLPSFRATQRVWVRETKEAGSKKVVAVSPSQHCRRQRERVVGWKLPGCRHTVRAMWRLCPLEQRARALWAWRGCVRGTVAHGQYVIVAGDVAATGKVIGVLGEAGGHSIGSLQNTHSGLCGNLGKNEGKIRQRWWRVAGTGWGERSRARCMQCKGSTYFLLSRLTKSAQAQSRRQDPRGRKLQDPAGFQTPEQQHTHQHHRHSCSHCPGGWQCLRRALHDGRGTSSPHSCSLYACKPALVGL